MVRKKYRLLIAVAALIAIACIIKSVIGISETNLEADFRKKYKLDNEWVCVKDTKSDLGVLLFYNEKLVQHTYAIYGKRQGISQGYSLQKEGISEIIDSGIQGFSSEKGLLLFSMNKKQAAEIYIEDGEKVEKRTLNPLKPFAVAIPHYPYSINQKVSLYDKGGEEISVDNIMLFAQNINNENKEKAQTYCMRADQEEGFVPYISLYQDGEFAFCYDVLSSYAFNGHYEIKDNILTATTDDKQYTYLFERIDENTLAFKQEDSSKVTLIDNRIGIEITDGAEFTK